MPKRCDDNPGSDLKSQGVTKIRNKIGAKNTEYIEKSTKAALSAERAGNSADLAADSGRNRVSPRNRLGLGRIASAQRLGQTRLGFGGPRRSTVSGRPPPATPSYNAGDGLGRMLRTLYLCDYLSNPAFRLEVLYLLNQGEAVHSLQGAFRPS
jgi:hypothetical protein